MADWFYFHRHHRLGGFILNENTKINTELTKYFDKYPEYSPSAVQIYKFLIPRDEPLPIVDANILIYSSGALSDTFKFDRKSEIPTTMTKLFRGDIINLGKSYTIAVPIAGKSHTLGFYTLMYSSNKEITESYLSFLSGITDIIKGEL